MTIVNPAVRNDLHAGLPLRLDLGCGPRPKAGFYGVDRVALPGVDIAADLNEPLADLPDNCVAEVYTRHTLEHVEKLLDLLAEIHRVTQPGGRVEVVVPHFSNPYGYSDPTHVRFFGLYSFFYFSDPADQPRRKVPSFYLLQRFRVETVRLHLMAGTLVDKLARTVLEPLVNHGPGWQDCYERRLCRWFPASSVRYVLRVQKDAATGRRAA
jgi:SAM-dependent methyltransferase